VSESTARGSQGPAGADRPVEMVDVVDSEDVVVDTVTRAEMRSGRMLHRSVAIAVLSSEGRLLVHRRSEDKDVWPGWWDIAAGGVVAAGESYLDAAHRELSEEVGLYDVLVVALGGGTYVDDDVATINRCYTVVSDGPFTFDDGEVVESRWVTAEELAVLRAEQRFVPDSIVGMLPLLHLR
jgi:isopentenyldiphosphate isomerase